MEHEATIDLTALSLIVLCCLSFYILAAFCLINSEVLIMCIIVFLLMPYSITVISRQICIKLLCACLGQLIYMIKLLLFMSRCWR